MPIFAALRLGLKKRASNKRAESGLTLIELMVAIAIIAVMFVVAASELRHLFDVDLKSSANHIASMMRYLSNKAVTENLYVRAVYDFETQSYWVEQSPDPFLIAPELKEAKFGQPDTKKTAKEKSEAKKQEAKKEISPEEPSAFVASESMVLKKTKLPSSVRFKDVYVDYVGNKKDSGQVYTYFFPDGYATGTIVHLQNADDDNDVFSIELLSLSGRVRVTREYVEPEK